jgi:hypothetical protein
VSPSTSGRKVAWALGVLVLVAGAVSLAYVLMANGPGDSGPIVGPGAAEKTRVALEIAPLIIVASVAVTWFGTWLAREADDEH